MTDLSASYGKTQALLEAKKLTEAREEYQMVFLPMVKQLYTETAQTYPTRFAKAQHWCDWVKNFYRTSVRLSKVIPGEDAAAIDRQISGIREQFYQLHLETDTRNAGDYGYAFRAALGNDKSTLEELKSLRAAAKTAQPPLKADGDKAAFEKARAEWLAAVDAALKDGMPQGAVREQLRQDTDQFYRAFGTQFE